ncbi:hypothetical protein [Gloeocapsa sp. PCC 73106]|uniref:hypothetical protein n=1 Tax=Gloeocapsa sp. PCC 73106 TaxID=102232 RepID=UPI0002AC9AD1|nr:hypothetical protein [Gloeocapsa sp. PCC 73106]ELR97184.1 hypothetical protein GLO73106DRAFT_00009890 [Gloeocapsa sp. PCC 73106]
MNYLIAVFANRIEAEAAYTALEKAGLPQSQIQIIGQGYQTPSEFGLVNPTELGKARALQMSYWLIPFGFAAGYTFNSITQFDLFPWAGSLGNHLIGGLFGAIAGAMGSIFVGGGVGLSTGSGSGDDLVYLNRLKEGKYLVAIDSSATLKTRGKEILASFKPEILNYLN